MSRTLSRTTGLLASVVLLVVSLAACGEASESEPADAGVDKVAFVDRLVGAVKEQGSAQAELTVGSGVSATAVFRYDGTEPAAGITATLLGQTIEVVAVDGFFYLKQNAGAKFVKLTRDDPSLSLLGGLADLDPEQALTGIADAVTSVRERGTETVDGVEVTRYEVTLDGEALGSGMLDAMPGVDLSEDLVVTLFVDARDLVRRAQADLGDNELVLTLTDWGEPVTITAPPAGEILQNE